MRLRGFLLNEIVKSLKSGGGLGRRKSTRQEGLLFSMCFISRLLFLLACLNSCLVYIVLDCLVYKLAMSRLQSSKYCCLVCKVEAAVWKTRDLAV
uniref:5'-nucleotidase n=1 Tax=Steinernema glaseri TaxID=37863 RepID=A0A1I7ZLJ2_9BILA